MPLATSDLVEHTLIDSSTASRHLERHGHVQEIRCITRNFNNAEVVKKRASEGAYKVIVPAMKANHLSLRSLVRFSS
eukprot:scaffold325384_cov38-Prasinocladus_malaysianus.AAC.1